MKKIFGEINLTWPKVIIMAILIGVYCAVIAMVPIARDTSLTNITVTFEVWIFFGIFIIMNSKSAKDSALKCFIFFLISQPLIYLVQDVVQGSRLFITYYRFWVGWTIGCIPMGFIGYYMKKDKWWGLIFILTPMLLLLTGEFYRYFSKTLFSFPRHIVTVIFCIATLIIYPQVIFKDKKLKKIGLGISGILIAVAIIFSISNPPIYSTEILVSGEEYQFDNTYKVYLKDKKYGDLSIKYDEGIESYMIHADFKKAGKTEFILEAPDGTKKVFDIKIRSDKYDYKEK